MLLLILWYCVDDHLASWMHEPAIGNVPFIFVLIIVILWYGIFGYRNLSNG